MKNRSISFSAAFILIPIISVGIWCYYYAIDQTSLINLVKLMFPVCIIMYIVGEFLFWAFLSKVKPSFRFGFWWGVFIIAPFYIYQVAFNGRTVLGSLKTIFLYPIYLVSGFISAIAIGFITWSIVGIVFQARQSQNPLRMALSRLVVIILCFAVLLPLVLKNRSAQPDLVAKRTSYRAFQERKLENKPSHRLIVLGIDGGDWDVIQPFVDEGKMPNMKKLMSEGRWGVMESVKPMRSPVLWTSMFTGQPPKKHGMEDWIISYSKNRLVKAIWNILSEYGLMSTIINIPGTFPPEEFLGKEISGFPYPNPTLNVYGWLLSTEPMKTKLTPFVQLDKTMDADGNYNGTINVTDVLIDKYNAGMRGKVFKNMAIEYVLKTKLSEIYGSDIPIAKFKFKPKEKKIDITPLKGEGQAFASIGDGEWSDFFMVSLEPGMVSNVKIRVLSMSDNNFVLYLTPFFQPSDNPKHQYTFPKTLAKDITDLFGQYIVEMTWMSAQDDYITFPAIKDILMYESEKKVKVGETMFQEGQWDLFIQVFSLTDRLQHPTWVFRYQQYEPSELANSEEGRKIIELEKSSIEDAYAQCDSWIGQLLDNMNPQKDILMLVSDHGFTQGTGREQNLGAHRLEGIYLVWGDPIKNTNRGDYKQNRGDKKSILDVTPNILYLLGLPVANDMPGQIWLDLYDDGFEKTNPPSSIETYNKEEDVKGTQQRIDPSALEQIKGLGYLQEGANIEGD